MSTEKIVKHLQSVKTLSATKLTTFTHCPRSYFFTHVLGLRGMYSDTFHMDFGSSIHLAFEHILKASQERDQAEVCEEAITIFNESLRKYQFVSPEEFLNTPNTKVMSNKAKTLDNAAQSIKLFSLMKNSLFPKYEILDTEVSKTLFNEDGYIFRAKLDILFRRNGLIGFSDIKTTGMESQAWNDHWSLSFQMLSYLLVLLNSQEDFAEEVSLDDNFIVGAIYKTKEVKIIKVPLLFKLNGVGNFMRTFMDICVNVASSTQTVLDYLLDGKPLPPNIFPCSYQCMDFGRMCPFAEYCKNNDFYELVSGENMGIYQHEFKQEFYPPLEETLNQETLTKESI